MSERGVTARLWAGTKNLKASPVPRKTGGLPFLPIVPAIIVIVGVAAGAALLRFGIEQLREQNDRSTAEQSRILTLTLGERLRATPHAGLTPDVLARVGRTGIGKRMREPQGTPLR